MSELLQLLDIVERGISNLTKEKPSVAMREQAEAQLELAKMQSDAQLQIASLNADTSLKKFNIGLLDNMMKTKEAESVKLNEDLTSRKIYTMFESTADANYKNIVSQIQDNTLTDLDGINKALGTLQLSLINDNI